MNYLDIILRKYIRGILLTMRVFPYFFYFSLYFPFFLLFLINSNATINTVLLWSVTIVFLHAMGFSYNTYCDRFTDPDYKNSIVAGLFTEKTVIFTTFLFWVGSFVSFIYLDPDLISYLLYFIYTFIWLSYSGLGLRLKENLIGPFYASIILWTGPLFLMGYYYNFLYFGFLMVLIGLFFIMSGYEIMHTIGDYEQDLKERCKTFSVRVGLEKSKIFENIIFFLGLIIFIIGVSFIDIKFSIFYVFFILIYMFLYYLRPFLENKTLIEHNPYYQFRLIVGILAIFLIDIPLILIIFLILIMFGEHLDRLSRLR